METAIKKGTGLDGILESYTPAALETVKRAGSNPNPITSIMEKYLPALELNFHIDTSLAKEYYTLLNQVTEILAPEEYPALLHQLLPQQAMAFFPYATGEFITKALKNSIAAGYTHFVLTPPFETALRWLFDGLEGTNERVISVCWKGNMGFQSCRRMRYARAEVRGFVDIEFAENSTYCEFIVHDLVGYDGKLGLFPDIGKGAEECRFWLHHRLHGNYPALERFNIVAYFDDGTPLVRGSP